MYMNSYQGPAEVSRGFVTASAGRNILTRIDVIHQSITIQKTFPWKARQNNNAKLIEAQ